MLAHCIRHFFMSDDEEGIGSLCYAILSLSYMLFLVGIAGDAVNEEMVNLVNSWLIYTDIE